MVVIAFYASLRLGSCLRILVTDGAGFIDSQTARGVNIQFLNKNINSQIEFY
jgi:hypothetical protein